MVSTKGSLPWFFGRLTRTFSFLWVDQLHISSRLPGFHVLLNTWGASSFFPRLLLSRLLLSSSLAVSFLSGLCRDSLFIPVCVTFWPTLLELSDLPAAVDEVFLSSVAFISWLLGALWEVLGEGGFRGFLVMTPKRAMPEPLRRNGCLGLPVEAEGGRVSEDGYCKEIWCT